MSIADIVKELDGEIARLRQAKQLLSGLSRTAPPSGTPSHPARAGRTKRVLSEEARQRIREAQRKRWAAQKKAAK